MARVETCELTNLCMIEDDHGNMLVQDRVKSWKGVTFPGGHVEPGESIVDSVIREVKEETNLDIDHVHLCGVKQYFHEDIRHIVFLFKTNCFSGTLTSSDEGKNFWIRKEDLMKYTLAKTFERAYEVYENDDLNESYMVGWDVYNK